MTKRKITLSMILASGGLLLGQIAATAADARPGGGARGGGARAGSMNVRSGSVSSVNWSNHSNVNRNTNINRNYDRNVNVNWNANINVDHDYNIDVDHDYHWGDHYHPVAAATAAAAVTAAAIGSYYRYLPANCVKVYSGSVVYYQCGTSWYQPYYAGTTVQYVVVKAPL